MTVGEILEKAAGIEAGDEYAMSLVDAVNKGPLDGSMHAVQFKANPAYRRMAEDRGGVVSELGGDAYYAPGAITGHAPFDKDSYTELADTIRKHKGGTASLHNLHAPLVTAAVAAPMLGAALSSLKGGEGAGAGLIHGLGASTGMGLGAFAGSKIGDKLQALSAVRKLSPGAQEAVTTASVALPAALGALLGYGGAKKITSRKKKDNDKD